MPDYKEAWEGCPACEGTGMIDEADIEVDNPGEIDDDVINLDCPDCDGHGGIQ